MSGAIRSAKRLYLVEDKSRVVEEGDPAARWLLCAAGGEVSRALAERYGMLDSPDPDPEPAAEADEPGEQPKARTPAANKARTRSTDK